MKKYFSFVLLLTASLIPRLVFGQSSAMDSLLNELKTSRPDTNRVKILNELARISIVEGYDPHKVHHYASQALELANKLGNEILIAQSLTRMGVAYSEIYAHDKAFSCFNQSIKLAQKHNHAYTLASNYFNVAMLYSNQSLPDTALLYYQKALFLLNKLNLKEGYTACIANIGNVYSDKGDYVNAIKYSLKGLRLAETGNYTGRIAVCANNLGLLFIKQDNLSQAEVYFKKSLRISQQINSQYITASNLVNLAIIHAKRRNYHQALADGKAALTVSRDLESFQNVIASLHIISTIYIAEGKFRQAKDTLLNALKITQKTGIQENVAETKHLLGAAFNGMGDYAAAIIYASQAVETAKPLGLKLMAKSGEKVLAEAYEKKKDYPQALAHYKLYTQYKDSLLNETNVRKVNELNLQYQTEKREGQIKVLSQQAQIQQLQLRQQQLYLAGSGSLVVLLLLFGFLFTRQQTLKNYQKTTELEQKLLVAQMNPHFIFNALIAIQNYMFKNSAAEAGKYLAKFAKLMRLILENSRRPYIALNKEIQTLEYYFELQQLRFQRSFDYQIYVDPQLNPEQVSVPPMLVQPLVENALEHGLLRKAEKGTVQVRYVLEGDKILLEVEDNGVGREEAAQFKQSTQVEYTSLATKITQERLAILNQRKNRKVTFNIVDLVNVDQVVLGTKATFLIPFRTLA